MGAEGHKTHTAITSYGYGTLCLKEGPNQPGSIFSALFLYFIPFYLLINFSVRDPHYIRPQIFSFHDPILRLPFATPFCDSTCDSHSRLTFTTPLATHIHDSRSRLHSRLTFATPDHAPSRNSLFFFATSRRVTPPLMDGLC